MHYDNIEILTSIFIAITKNKNYQKTVLRLKNFEKLNIKINDYNSIFTLDLVVVTLENYNKFFSKI